MKRIVVLFSLLLILTGCGDNVARNEVSPNGRYQDMIDLIAANQNFMTSSEYYDITCDIAAIDGGYRYYVIIDNPRIALYDIEAMAIENGVDYHSVMAASVGIFEDQIYKMVPNQIDEEKGYVKGVILSGVTTNETPHVKMLVQWQDEMLTNTYREYFAFDITPTVADEGAGIDEQG